jgi:hypothetical protein
MVKKNVETETETTAVATATKTEVAVQAPPALGYGAADDIGGKDIKIERILLTQSMTKKVQADEVEKGKLIIQSTLEELGSIKSKSSEAQDMEFIPVKAMRYWVETDKDTQEFIARFPALDPDEHEWEEKRGARTIKRTYTHAFIVLLPSKIANMEDAPIELAFRSTNLQCAQSINMKLLSMKRHNLPSWAKVFKLKIDTKTKGDNMWYITTDSISRDSTPEEIKIAEEWAKMLQTATLKLDENDGGGEGSSNSLPPLNGDDDATY